MPAIQASSSQAGDQDEPYSQRYRSLSPSPSLEPPRRSINGRIPPPINHAQDTEDLCSPGPSSQHTSVLRFSPSPPPLRRAGPLISPGDLASMAPSRPVVDSQLGIAYHFSPYSRESQTGDKLSYQEPADSGTGWFLPRLPYTSYVRQHQHNPYLEQHERYTQQCEQQRKLISTASAATAFTTKLEASSSATSQNPLKRSLYRGPMSPTRGGSLYDYPRSDAEEEFYRERRTAFQRKVMNETRDSVEAMGRGPEDKGKAPAVPEYEAMDHDEANDGTLSDATSETMSVGSWTGKRDNSREDIKGKDRDEDKTEGSKVYEEEDDGQDRDEERERDADRESDVSSIGDRSVIGDADPSDLAKPSQVPRLPHGVRTRI